MKLYRYSPKKSALLFLAITILVLSMSLAGCGKKAPQESASTCPYTSLTWDATVEDMIALEGEDYETYDSIYKGMTYTYPKEYLGHTGMIKYMYDADGRLCNMSWSYTGETADDLKAVYDGVCQDATTLYGEGETDDGVGNLCKMWVETEETIMANAVITDDTKVMQIAYMRADVSKQNNS
ncbi:MAG: hypothetical protein IIU45_05500 [Lachnospiraceae bacterium]|nr:hypothetical protein [Lachnospiraceae bacterium]MBQ5376307.1 hypothetical protein [Lachnospiraceae bacterium]